MIVVKVTSKWLNNCKMDKNFYYQVQGKSAPKSCTLLRFAVSDTYICIYINEYLLCN